MTDFTFTTLKPGAHVHFIGIGGISMSALAEILLQKNYIISGSDIQKSPLTDKLAEKGASIFIGHVRENIKDADLIIYTAAVDDTNPEMQEASALNIPTIDRPKLLGAIMKKYPHAIAVAGTHGKTTTTSMVSTILMHAKMDPTILVGELLDNIGGNVRIGDSTYFVTEACEYCESFLKFYPHIGIVLNIEEDHLDYYRDLNHILEAFKKFARLIPQEGSLIVCGDDANAMQIVNDATCNVVTYGTHKAHCDWRAQNIHWSKQGFANFDVAYRGNDLGNITLRVPGVHNVYNSIAAIACAHVLGVDFPSIAQGISAYTGARRRFEYKGNHKGFTVVSDYAHHPTEIKATLNAALKYPHNRIWCIFQPHTYTRTLSLIDTFKDSFDVADHIIITDIYAAREKDDGSIHAKDLVKKIKDKGIKASYIAKFDDIASYVKAHAQKDDLVLTMGAGSIDQLGEMIISEKSI